MFLKWGGGHRYMMQNIIYNVGSNLYIHENDICIVKFTMNSFIACSVSVGLYMQSKNGEKYGTYFDLLYIWANTELVHLSCFHS
jgi:hypothetical protein